MKKQETIVRPKDLLEFLQWTFYEPELVGASYKDIVGWKARLFFLLEKYLLLSVITTVLYLLSLSIVVFFDLPLIPKAFTNFLQEVWTGDPIYNFQLLFRITLPMFIQFIVANLCFVLFFGFSELGSGLMLGLIFSICIGLLSGQAGGLAVGSVFRLVGGILFGLAGAWSIGWNLVFRSYNPRTYQYTGWIIGLGVVPVGVYFVLFNVEDSKLIGGLGVLVSWFVFYYRIPWFIVYSFKMAFRRYTLEDNPHYRDGLIILPIFNQSVYFSDRAFEAPDRGRSFMDFLFKRRINQRPMALVLTHAVSAGVLNQNRLDVPALRNIPEIDENDPQFRPTGAWYDQLQILIRSLDDSQKSNNIWQRKKYFEQFREALDRFYEITVRESPRWNRYYLRALEKWKKSAETFLHDLELEAQTQEPICANIYRGGEKLDPTLDKPLFLGRDDLRDTFKNRVLTAQAMPMFFVQGQRRTGKSSLIAFLPQFLDRGFVVASLDLQTLGTVTVPGLFKSLHRVVCQAVTGEQGPPLQLPKTWVDAWQMFRKALENIAEKDGRRIVLAIDEYEELHKVLHREPKQGAALLSAMRSFSQSQNRVVFLFAGADFFSELTQPNWNEYFVQAVTLQVDYLDREDTIRLVTLADLRYPPELLEHIWQDTQGHPCLLQKICQEIVTNANKSLRKDITRADYDLAVKNVVLRRDNGVVDVFWLQFCQQRGLKDTVRQILHGKSPADKKQLLILEDHGFIVRQDGHWRLRVPLFEAWLERYEAF